LLQGKWRNFVLSGKYKILGPLGAGGMGYVFLCEHQIMRRRVAIKVLPLRSSDFPSTQRFHREARAVAQLKHTNIVGGYDIDQDGKRHFLVMEYIDGSTFRAIVKGHGRLAPLRAAHYIRQAALGLQHAHEAGLVHRDIKPSNLLLDRTGTVKILDLGLARFFHDETDDLSKRYSEGPIGTMDYMAPEQALDSHHADIRADIYSLGATFYFLLADHGPFPEGTTLQKMVGHQLVSPRPIRSLYASLLRSLSIITARAVNGLEMDASSKTESVRNGVFFSKSAYPKAFL
jgi:serine/threonine protein kinase